MKKNLKNKKLVILVVFLCMQFFLALEVGATELGIQSLDFSPVTKLIRTIISSIAPYITLIVGFLGTGRAAYKFMHGDPDASTALLTAVIGYGLALVANNVSLS